MLSVTSHTLLRLIEVVPELRAALPQVDEPWRKPLHHLTTGQIRMVVSKLLLKEHERSGNFFHLGQQAQAGDNVKAQRRVTSTQAMVEISSPRSARPAQPLKKWPSPYVCFPLFGMNEASCAETSSERGSSAALITR